MPFLRINSDLTDKNQIKNSVFSLLVDKIPRNKSWFGISVRRIDPTQYTGKSTSAALFLAFAKVISDFVHTVFEFSESITLTPTKVTDRWIEHLKNTYLDYYGEEETSKVAWEKTNFETPEQYIARLTSISLSLKNLFNLRGISVEELSRSLDVFYKPKNIYFDIEECWTNLKPYPSSKDYVVSKLSGESDDNFKKRLEVYTRYYQENNFNTYNPPKFYFGEFVRLSNFNPFNVTDTSSSYEETEQEKQKRLDVLKKDLGTYGVSYGTQRRYFDYEQFTGVIKVNLYSNTTEINLEEFLNSIKSVKPAGTLILFTVHVFAGQPSIDITTSTVELKEISNTTSSLLSLTSHVSDSVSNLSSSDVRLVKASDSVTSVFKSNVEIAQIKSEVTVLNLDQVAYKEYSIPILFVTGQEPFITISVVVLYNNIETNRFSETRGSNGSVEINTSGDSTTINPGDNSGGDDITLF